MRLLINIITGVAIAGVAVAVLLLIICYCYYGRVITNEETEPREVEMPQQIIEQERHEMTASIVSQIDMRHIKSATNDFDKQFKIGNGGFGHVYKCSLMSGQDVAVKRLVSKHGQGDAEFSTEVSVLANLRHANLVKLLHFSVDLDSNERVLVYEYVRNGSLDSWIFDQDESNCLDWDNRRKIIVGSATGISYIHNNAAPTFVHRDLKPSNILLDEKWNPKIADFGLAKLLTSDQMEQYTNNFAGTSEYVPPEYMFVGRYSVKTDVYSFGVVVLETICGKKNRCGENEANLVTYAWGNWSNEETISNIIDPFLLRTAGSGGIADIKRCINIALLCLQEDEDRRPTMAKVVEMLQTNCTLGNPVRSKQQQTLEIVHESQECSINSAAITNFTALVPPPVVPMSTRSNSGNEAQVVERSAHGSGNVSVPETSNSNLIVAISGRPPINPSITSKVFSFIRNLWVRLFTRQQNTWN